MAHAGSATRSAPAPSGEIRPLTGLRGVAACYVVLYHMLQDWPGDGPGATMLHHGYLAVDVFFVLSGFVLALVHGRDRFDRAGYGLFLRKRLARIYPLYAVVTAGVVMLLVGHGVAISPGHLAVNVLLLQGWGVGTSIVGPAWSLSAECAAYLLFPLFVALVVWGSRAQALACVGLAMLVLALFAFEDPVPRSGPLDLYQSNTVAPLLRCLGGFVLGLAAFRLWQVGAGCWLAGRWTGAGIGTLMIGLLAWRDSDLTIVALAVPFVVALAADRDGVASLLLAKAVPYRLGVLSFSIYLVHFPIRDWVRPPLADWLANHAMPQPWAVATLAACGATLAFAACTYRLIERPARSMVRHHLRLAPSAS